MFAYKNLIEIHRLNWKSKSNLIYIYAISFIIITCLFSFSFFSKNSEKDFIKNSALIKKKNVLYVDELYINKGETLSKVLSAYQLPIVDLNKIASITKSKIDFTNLKVGQGLRVQYSIDENNMKKAISLQIDIDKHKKIEIYKDPNNNSYKTKDIHIAYNRDIIKAEGVIRDSIVATALRSGVPMKNILELINTYSYQIDFQREIREGDRFTILFEKFTAEDKKSVYFGKTIFSSLNLRGHNYNMYRFKRDNGLEDFFDEKYSSIKRSLLKTPVMAARISSRFGLRKHPISGFTQMHQGVDFAAPKGTPIYAAGNGTITEIGRKGAYGKYLKIRHSNDISTAYGHAKSFAKDLKKGSFVKQGEIIAYVGNTGRATGPHLHYEVIKNGKKVNPLTLKLIPVVKLIGKEREDFLKYKKTIDLIASNKETQLIAGLKQYIF